MCQTVNRDTHFRALRRNKILSLITPQQLSYLLYEIGSEHEHIGIRFKRQRRRKVSNRLLLERRRGHHLDNLE